MSKDRICLLEEKVDQEWCSEVCKQKVSDVIIKRYPCKQKFVRVDVNPLYANDPQRFYRVTLWVNNWLPDSSGPVKEIWKTLYVTLEGIERKIISIKEGRKQKLKIGEKGIRFMKELGIPYTEEK